MNGCDAMSQAEPIDRKLTVRTQFTDRMGVTISIADRGTGVPPHRLERIFEPFYTTKSHGLGLGLAVSRTIISAHGGTLSATNNSDRGASFHVTLPVFVEVPEPMQTQERNA
jgi:C4-dicarboxylate-specific signal transduction histidine kinase